MDNFDIGEIMSKNKGRKLVGKPSMSKILYKKVFAEYEVPRAKKESVMRSEKANTMGSFGVGLPGDSVVSPNKALGVCGFNGPCAQCRASTSGMGSGYFRTLGVRLPAQAPMLRSVVINLGWNDTVAREEIEH